LGNKGKGKREEGEGKREKGKQSAKCKM